jgi:GNAT superfamily N-acetyltransferase
VNLTALARDAWRESTLLFNISAAKTDEDILDTYYVMSQLRPDIQRSEYVQRVRQQESEVGFQLVALRDGERVICVAGFRLCRSLGWGRFLYLDDLVTDEAFRSQGAGGAMFDWLVDQARKAQCSELRLDSAQWRHGAHRFYLCRLMEIACFHFRLDLADSRVRINP